MILNTGYFHASYIQSILLSCDFFTKANHIFEFPKSKNKEVNQEIGETNFYVCFAFVGNWPQES